MLIKLEQNFASLVIQYTKEQGFTSLYNFCDYHKLKISKGQIGGIYASCLDGKRTTQIAIIRQFEGFFSQYTINKYVMHRACSQDPTSEEYELICDMNMDAEWIKEYRALKKAQREQMVANIEETACLV